MPFAESMTTHRYWNPFITFVNFNSCPSRLFLEGKMRSLLNRETRYYNEKTDWKLASVGHDPSPWTEYAHGHGYALSGWFTTPHEEYRIIRLQQCRCNVVSIVSMTFWAILKIRGRTNFGWGLTTKPGMITWNYYGLLPSWISKTEIMCFNKFT